MDINDRIIKAVIDGVKTSKPPMQYQDGGYTAEYMQWLLDAMALSFHLDMADCGINRVQFLNMVGFYR